jgi:lipid-A-disaccharide synthase-like uncharacterized protein
MLATSTPASTPTLAGASLSPDPRRVRRRTMLDWSDDLAWLIFGFVGNAVFASRFLVQWIVSERAGESVVPRVFWVLSIAGSLVLLVYALHLGNPVFVLAYLPNGFVYARNLQLISRKQAREAAS